MPSLQDPISIFPKVGPATVRNFKTLGIKTVRDLLWHFPRRYVDFRTTIPISQVKTGQTVTLHGTIKSTASQYGFRSHVGRAEAILSDKTGSIKLVWFNQPYMANNLHSGDKLAIAGTARYYKKTLQIQNPIYEKLDQESIHTGRLVPIYSGGVSNRTIRTLIKAALPAATAITDTLPQQLRERHGLPALGEVVSMLHYPESEADIDKARNRIALDELLINQLAMRLRNDTKTAGRANCVPLQTEYVTHLLTDLPFQLTDSQKRALWDSMQDISRDDPMVRLLQGDVGSGKTIVAGLLTAATAAAGFQSAFVAPTEILAQQHFEYLVRHFPSCRIALLSRNFIQTNNASAGQLTKKQLLSLIAEGTVDILVGTHAVLQSGVSFGNLALAVIDEQHRFGVAQRSFLLNQNNNTVPHLLSMSATPIPRTLALSFYGDLKLSILTTVPHGRVKITTSVALENERPAIYQQIKQEILQKKAQAFIVTPRVEDNETSPLKSVKEEFSRLKTEQFRDIPMGLLYGTMKGSDKSTVMAAFNSGETKIIVTTSVIETGIDVPAASIMIIEGAERFGLAQLHQLRGRIGRAGQESHCFLFPTTEDSSGIERLRFFASCQDGFKLAEKDLQQRGFGNLFGTEQSGFDFQFPEFFTLDMVTAAKNAAETLLTESPTLSNYPAIRTRVSNLIQTTHAE